MLSLKGGGRCGVRGGNKGKLKVVTTWAINSYLQHYLTIPSFPKVECKSLHIIKNFHSHLAFFLSFILLCEQKQIPPYSVTFTRFRYFSPQEEPRPYKGEKKDVRLDILKMRIWLLLKGMGRKGNNCATATLG